MNTKEFKSYILSELDKALQTANPFTIDDLTEIESLRGQIKSQIKQLALDHRRDIRDQITELTNEINSIYQQYGWIEIQFPNGKGKYRMVNAWQEINRVKWLVKKLADSSAPRKYSFKNPQPCAHKVELFEGIVLLVKEGWFTDGHVLVKGTAPKNADLKYEDKKPAEVDWMLKLETKPARLLYFFFENENQQYVSDRPLPTYFHTSSRSLKDSTDPSVVFECDKKFWFYNQNKYNLIANRYSNINRYEINEDGYLKFFIDDEIVGLMMPYRPSGDTIYTTELPLKQEAMRAGLYKENPNPTLSIRQGV